MNLCSNLEIQLFIIPGAVEHILDLDVRKLFKICDINNTVYM